MVQTAPTPGVLSPNLSPDLSRDLASARQTLAREVEGLEALAQSLDDSFSRAVDTIHRMKQKGRGRLIVAGIGKSGHIARKIAATLASTATPAYYIHPGEASHGDLGMITEDDVMIMLSYSGTNAELTDMILYAQRFHIPLIAITGNAQSPLALHADHVLLLPKVAEACPNGLAPTTSTTQMMALGDCIAIALLERVGLTAEQFRVWHPGGKLGQKLRKVTDFMIKESDLPLVSPQTLMSEALIILSEKNLGSVIIIDDEHRLLGIITDGDLKRHMSPDLLQKPVAEIMNAHPRTILQDMLGVKALDLMIGDPTTPPITSLIVTTTAQKVVGLLRIQELLRAGLS